MTVYLSNRDGNGKTNEEGHYRFQTRVFSGFNLLSNDLAVTQQSPLALGVTVGSGDYRLETASGYSYTGWIDAPTNVTIPTADASNPRISIVVLYVDKGATTTASPPNNPGIAKLITVQGTAAANPIAPSGSAIQSAVGAGNPYYSIAQVTVGAGATQVTNSNITDLRTKVRIASDVLNYSDIYTNISSLIYPIGSIYSNATNSANPSTYLGFGNWVAYAQGRVPVGNNASDSDFNGVNETGGVKTNTITTDQLPVHTHVVDPPNVGTSASGDHVHGNTRDVVVTSGAGSSRAYNAGNGQQFAWSQGNITAPAGNHAHTVDIPAFNSGPAGNGQPINNMPPYITVFMWLRTA